jgi:hypothetical protein
VAVLVHEDDLGCIDPGEVCVARGDDRVEVPDRPVDDQSFPLSCLFGAGRIGLHHDDSPAGELERVRVNACEPELEHAPRPFSQQLDDPRRRRGSKGRRKPSHDPDANVPAPGCRIRG